MDNHDKQLEDGIFIGNQVDKSNLKNPISRRLVGGFDAALFAALDLANPKDLHEVGCGEGRLTRMIQSRYGLDIYATDFSGAVISENINRESGGIQFEQLSIYDLDAEKHARDVIVCCEVLEHLEEPKKGLKALKRLRGRRYVLSVPREPIWRALNMARLKYWPALGNTPGHLNHWSVASFDRFLEAEGFRVLKRLNPFPWIMVLAELIEY